MSKTNCLRPSNGFYLNLRALIVNSPIAATPPDISVRNLAVCRFEPTRQLEP